MDFDLCVIGGGSGGVRAARMAAGHGARVGLCEEARMGGTCVNIGCVPKTLLVYASRFSGTFEDAARFGWEVPDVQHDWSTLIANKDAEIQRLNKIYESLLTRAGVEVIRGHGVIEGANQVRVGERTFRSKRILIATGGGPWRPSIPGIEHSITSDEAFGLGNIPKRVVVVGGGYIAVEFAGIFRGCGADVQLVHRGEQVLRGFDGDVRAHLTSEMTKRGVGVHLGREVKALHKGASGVEVRLSDESVLQADCVLFATGRRPNTTRLFHGHIGVELGERGEVVVNEEFQTSVPSIYAVGDVIDRAALTPVALAEGMWLAHHLFGDERTPVSYENIPTAVFSTPTVATVGLTEEQAIERGHSVTIFRSTFRPMVHTVSGRDERAMMKLVVDSNNDRVLGCHMVGDSAGEIIQGVAVALTCEATKSQFDRTLGIHPTAAEEFVTMRTPVAS